MAGPLAPVPTAVAAPVTYAKSAHVPSADLTKFQPGNIISDAAFFNSSTMTEGQIQAFLEARVPNCQSGYTCLKDWYDTSRTTTADAMCGAYSGGVRERASRIIYKVAQACGINPQVILATLEKEQGLVRHTWPSEWRYTIAMGQGCPDTAACDTRYYGFFNQVYGAAWQFKRYANPAGTSQYFTWYAPGKTWNVLYNPNHSCGSSPVYIQNQATANLYYYTPYQPNVAALRAGYGTGDGCSAYGNRNFYNFFTDWFGSAQAPPVDPCAVPSDLKSAFKTYVVTPSSLNARSAPSTSCGRGVLSLPQSTVVQATAVVDGWLRVNTESGDRWVAREYVRYASESETACALPGGTGTAQYAYLVTSDTAGRIVPNAACAVSTTDVPTGTVVQAFAVNATRDWVKVRLEGGDRWIDRAALIKATDAQARCVVPGDTGAAKLTYTIRAAGTSGRAAPDTGCGIEHVSLSGGTIVRAVGANAARDWLKVATAHGEKWVNRAHLTATGSADLCEFSGTSRAAVRLYVVEGEGRAYSAPSLECTAGSLALSAGSILRPSESTAAGEWLRVDSPDGERWVPRISARAISVSELCQLQPADARGAKLTYTVIAATSARVAPYPECSEGGTEVVVGQVATATAVTAAGDWLKLRLGSSELWVPRDAVRYATAAESCAPVSGTREAHKVYTFLAEETARTAPYPECGTGAVTVPSNRTAVATEVTGAGDWLRLNLEEGSLWVPRASVRYATTGETCPAPSDAKPARLTYIITVDTVARTAPYGDCASGSAALAAGTVATATAVTAAGDWLKLRLTDGEYWVLRSDTAKALAG
ncbi:SH3 domain-containing protein [Microbacterium sp. NPDC077184]|uniref:SH3 domain-containing protein n=1 Tax=Microbacterium sp. NPDC077184 TaxID=3154764 RepID=UPI0034182B51